MNGFQWIFRLALGRRLPTTSGTLTVPGPCHPITIRRDSWAIPYIHAQDDHDAWFGLGFCQGQDRAFQLETLLRVVRGTLAEVVGPAGLPVDKLARRIGFFRSAQAQVAVLDSDVRAMLDAYAEGVSIGSTRGTRKRAHEFALLRGKPTPWTAADVLGLLKLQSFALVSNWDVELARYKVLSLDGEEALKALDATYPDWHPVSNPPGTHAGTTLDHLSADIAAFTEFVKLGGGSNNWAIAATRTRTGRPILANDPHLPGILPSHWYLAHIRTPDWEVAGASFVGGPTFPAAHNGHAAWGVTVGLVDDTDLFLEEVGPDGNTIRQGNEFIPCQSWIERIHVKGAAIHDERVLMTPRGPIISSLVDTTDEKRSLEPPGIVPVAPAHAQGIVRAFSLRAVWLDPVPVRGLLGLPKARNFGDFRRCLAQWPGLSLNVAYADAAGTIGWQLSGIAPRRKKGYGTLPMPGWDKEAGWHADPVPFEEMPYVENPATGFVGTANNKPASHGPFLSTDYADGYRIATINETLAARQDWDIDATLALQLGVQSLPWREIREIVLACPVSDPDAAMALQMLRNWNAQVAADSAGAAIYELFVADMSVRVAKAKAPRSYEWIVGSGASIVTPEGFFAVRRVAHLVRLLRTQPPDWFARPWSEEIADALAESVRRLRVALGPDPARWSWGGLRPLTLRHPISVKRPFDRIFNLGPIPFGGDANTIAQAAVKPLDPTGDPGFMPSLRMAIDVGNWSASRFAIPGGQSGNPLSPHYADQLPIWLKNEGVPIVWTEEEIGRAARDTLRLEPAPGSQT